MMYILDTNVVREISGQSGNKEVRRWLKSVNDSDLYITAVVVLEGQKGIEKQRGEENKKPNLPKVADGHEKNFEKFLSNFNGRILPIDVDAARELGRRVSVNGGSQEFYDKALISIAASRPNAIVVTRNVGHFTGQGVKVINPFKDPPREYAENVASGKND